MSVRLMSAVWDLDLPPNQKIVLLALADSANDFGANCYPSVATLCRKTSMPERTLQRVLADLKTSGIVEPYFDYMGKVRERVVRAFRLHIAGIANAPIPDFSNCPRSLRLETISAFGRTCAYCQGIGDDENGPDGRPWHIDRIVAGSRGGKYIAENVTLACAACNASKGANLAPLAVASLAQRMVPPMAPQGANLAPEGCQSGTPVVPNQANCGATHGTQSIRDPSLIREGSTPDPAQTGHPGFDRMHNWKLVSNINVEAYQQYLNHLEQLVDPKPKRLSPAGRRARAEMVALTGPLKHQADLLAWHRENDYRPFYPLSPEQLAERRNAGAPDHGRRESFATTQQRLQRRIAGEEG